MHCLQACLFEYITVAAFRIYALRGEDEVVNGRLEAVHKIFMEITSLIMENHGKIMELCFSFSVGTQVHTHEGLHVGRIFFTKVEV